MTSNSTRTAEHMARLRVLSDEAVAVRVSARREVVRQHLRWGRSVEFTARHLGVCERTIERDRAFLRTLAGPR